MTFNSEQQNWVLDKVNLFQENKDRLFQEAEKNVDEVRTKIFSDAFYGDDDSDIRGSILYLKKNMGVEVPFQKPKIIVRMIRNLIFQAGANEENIKEIERYLEKVLVGDNIKNIDKERFLDEFSWQIESIINLLDQGISIKNVSGKYVAANDIQKKICKREDEDLAGKDDDYVLKNIMSPEEINGIKYRDRLILNGEEDRIVFEIEGEDNNENYICYKTIKLPIKKHDEIIGVVTRNIDITQRKLIERDQDRHLEEITYEKDLIEQRAQEYLIQQEELRNLNDKLEKLNKGIKKLLGVIGHDLKNPLGAIMGMINMFIEDEDETNPKLKMTPEDRLLFLKSIASSAEKILRILQDSLEIGRSDDLDPHPENLSIDSIVEGVISLYKDKIDKKNINVIYDKSNIDIFTDKHFVETILRNLIANAVKFTDDKGFITIAAYSDETNLNLIVEDTGVGIKEENIPKLFDPSVGFTTYSTDGEKGTGFGLSLCKDYAKKCGGDMDVRSEIGKGTRFTVSIPLKLEDKNNDQNSIDSDSE